MGAPNSFVVIDDLSGGLNLTDPPLALKPNECMSAINVEWVRSKFGRKRNGSTAITTSFVSGGPFANPIGSMTRHVPGTNEAAAEVWAVSTGPSPVFGRKAASTQFTQLSPYDALTGNAYDVTWASIDGELFIAYDSGVNRLHVWDGTLMRRTGIAPGGIPTTANQGSGSYPAVARYYRVRYWYTVPNIVSEPTTATAVITPSGTGLSMRVTKSLTEPTDAYDFWVLEASTDNVAFYQIAVIPAATTFYDDAYLTSQYAVSFTLSPLTGTFNVQKSYRFIAGADNRLLGFGTFQAAALGVKQNRVEISDIVGGGTLGVTGIPVSRAAETVNTTAGYYVDLDESDSGPATGLKGPCFGNYYAFKSRQMWELRPTGDATRPFAATAISKTIGAVSHQSIVIGEDDTGHQALYFWSHKGPYRYTTQGLEYIGRNLEGYFKDNPVVGGLDITLDATICVAHGLFHVEARQVWWWVALGAGANEPNALFFYHTATGGWSSGQGTNVLTGMQNARCSAMLPNTQGATMSRLLKPHYAGNLTDVTHRITRADDQTSLTDDGTTFSTLLATRPVVPGGPGIKGHVGDVQIVARGTNATLTLETLPDLVAYEAFNPIRRLTTCDLTPLTEEVSAGLVPWIYRRFDDSGLDEVLSAGYRISDTAAIDWTVDRLIIPVRTGGAVIT